MAAQHIVSSPEGANDVTIEWQDLEVDLKTVKLKHNKSGKIKIKQTQHSNEEQMDEKKVEHNYFDPSKLAKTMLGGSVTSGAALYGGQLGLDLAAGAAITSIGSEAAIAASALATGGGAFAAVGFAGWGIHSAYTYYKNYQEDNKLDKKKGHNTKVKLFNVKLAELKIVEEKLLEKTQALKQQERKLNNKTFQIERKWHDVSKAIVCIGPTGYGKSLVCNRLIGNIKCIDDLEESKDEAFNVAECGNAESLTKDISKQIKQVNIVENDIRTAFVVSVIDTPGAFDSDGRDKQFQNELAEYFRASGGVNMFCIFWKFAEKIDQNFKKLLEIYETFWGKDFWKHAVIVITNCDRDSEKNEKRVEKSLPKTKEKIRNYLKEKNVLDEIPMYEFGEDNFQASVQEILSSLVDRQKVYHQKYKCDKIVSPIDELFKKIKPMKREHRLLCNELDTFFKDVKESKAKIN